MKKFFSLVLALAMALSMASFASAEETTTIHIGVIGPMTGAAAVYGLAVARGAEIAVEEINAAGKVNIVLDVQDDENDAEKSINAYNATLDKGTQVILGCVTTTPCIAVSAQAYDERVFMLTPSASSLEVIANKDNAYQVCFTDPAQGSASAEYIFNKKVGEKVAIIYNNADTYSTGIYQTFESKAAELGLNIVSVTTFTNDTTDFSVQVTEAKNAGADVVFLPIYCEPASMILTQADTMGYKPVFFHNHTFFTSCTHRVCDIRLDLGKNLISFLIQHCHGSLIVPLEKLQKIFRFLNGSIGFQLRLQGFRDRRQVFFQRISIGFGQKNGHRSIGDPADGQQKKQRQNKNFQRQATS